MKFIQTPKHNLQPQPTFGFKDILFLFAIGFGGLVMFFGLGALIAAYG